MKPIKTIFLTVSLGIGLLGCQSSKPMLQEDSLNILSFNIRYNNPNDGKDAWPHRKQHVSALIEFHQADVVGVQEALSDQLEDLNSQLPQYAWFGVGRDDGKQAGEFTAIFYRKDKVSLQKQGTFWCSPTPDIPSIGWDADLNRTVTWGYFRRNNGKGFYVFNTHLDHLGKTARAECAQLIRRRVDQITQSEPTIITGDFNTRPTEQPYKYMTDNEPYNKVIYDASKVTKLPAYGSKFTSTQFNIAAVESAPIDYIFTSEAVKVARFGVLSDSFNGRLPSDHYPLLVEINLP